MKPKINSIENTDDSIWFRIPSGDESVKLLQNIFNIDDEAVGNREGYSDLISYHQYLDEEGYLAYVLYLESDIHVILRKVRSWEKKRDEIMKYFTFQA